MKNHTKNNKTKKKAQIWVETVIYTLIGLAIIGLLLAISKPKIDQMKDKSVIEQTIDSMNKIDSKIFEVIDRGIGNKRRIDELKISKGRFIINPVDDEISWILDSSYKYSEPDQPIALGRLNVLTTKDGDKWEIEISAEYPVDLTYDGREDLKEFSISPSPYAISILNNGTLDNRIQVDLKVD